MQLFSKQSDSDTKDLAYDEPWHHLRDELKYLDLQLQSRITRRYTLNNNDPLAQLKGLVLSEEEIDELLNDQDSVFGDVQSSRATKAEVRKSKGQLRELTQSLTALEEHIESRRLASSINNTNQTINSQSLTLPYLAQLFQLSRFEERCLLICLAPEVNSKYDKLYAYMHDDVTRKRPSVELVLSLICNTPEDKLVARVMFEPQAPLIKHRLVQVFEPPSSGPLPLLTRSLKLDDRIVDFLLGNNAIDTRLANYASFVYPDEQDKLENIPAGLGVKLRELVNVNFGSATDAQRKLVFHVEGRYGAGKLALCKAVAKSLNLPLLTLDIRSIPSESNFLSDTIWLAAREAFLQPAVLCIENFHHLSLNESAHGSELKALCEAVEMFSQLTFILSERSWSPQGKLKKATYIDLRLPLPDSAARAALWQQQMQYYTFDDAVDAGSIASQFRFTPGQIRDALNSAQHSAYWRDPRNATISTEDLYAACRAQSNPKLKELTRKIEPHYQWVDIILPSDSYQQLKDICQQARNRHVVLGKWGFGRKLSLGKGLAVMFSGPPGTGKTMAAEVVASELALDLYKIDLSQVVSKYIGETEKNLDQIFNAAEHANAILFFDEADALFGKRSEVRDSHDRYANVEVSYLLQKMEEYEGISILATNLRKHMDDAFLRRLQAVVEFPFPDVIHREKIWRVTFPEDAPLGEDVDIPVLAQHIRLSGGNIKNIGLNAAFYAASDGGVIHMPHLLQAAQREHKKLGRTWTSPASATGVEGAV